MQVIVAALVASLPGLMSVSVLLSFFFAVFGVMGVLLFGGQLQYRCAVPDFSAAWTNDDGLVQVGDAAPLDYYIATGC